MIVSNLKDAEIGMFIPLDLNDTPPRSPSHRRRSRLAVVSPKFSINSNRRSAVHRMPVVAKPVKPSSSVKVCIRVRPPNAKESRFKDGKQVVEIMDDHVLVFDPMEVPTPSFHRGIRMRDPTTKRNRDLKFGFGRVFGIYSTNEQVFQETTRQTLDSLMSGFNCSVFAYGATGSGKTFTMLGTETNKGVIARTVHALYERIEAVHDTTICEVEVSYLEIYNESVRDLLNVTGQELVLRETNSGVAVGGLSFHKPTNVAELYKMLEVGNANRTQHPTDANKESSRSHAVFHIYLKQRGRAAGVSADIVVSKMALIDLAGSERAIATANCGKRFREGANINRSLLALGNCINALADGKKGNHIPYRDSKLTRILKDSLGGNCQTVMIAAISPSAMAYDDTYNTLKYADRAQKIKLELKSNVYRVDQNVHQYGKVVEQLQSEVMTLRDKNAILEREKKDLEKQLEDANANRISNDMDTSVPAPEKKLISDHTFNKQILELNDRMSRFIQRQEMLLELESQRRILHLKIQYRDQSLNQLNEMQWDLGRKELIRNRWEKFQQSSENKLEQLSSQIDQVGNEIRRLKQEINNEWQASNDIINSNPNANNDVHRLIMDSIFDRADLCRLKAIERHSKSALDYLSSRMILQNRVVEAMGSLVKDEYLLLKSYGNHSSGLIERFENVEKLIEGSKVCWSDQNGNGELILPNDIGQLFTLPNCTTRSLENFTAHLSMDKSDDDMKMDQRDVTSSSDDESMPLRSRRRPTPPKAKISRLFKPTLYDEDGFKRPPLPPQRFKNGQTSAGSSESIKVVVEPAPSLKTDNGPSLRTVRKSPLVKTPSQSSLLPVGNKRPQDQQNGGSTTSNGNGLRRNASSSSLKAKWHY